MKQFIVMDKTFYKYREEVENLLFNYIADSSSELYIIDDESIKKNMTPTLSSSQLVEETIKHSKTQQLLTNENGNLYLNLTSLNKEEIDEVLNETKKEILEIEGGYLLVICSPMYRSYVFKRLLELFYIQTIYLEPHHLNRAMKRIKFYSYIVKYCRFNPVLLGILTVLKQIKGGFSAVKSLIYLSRSL